MSGAVTKKALRTRPLLVSVSVNPAPEPLSERKSNKHAPVASSKSDAEGLASSPIEVSPPHARSDFAGPGRLRRRFVVALGVHFLTFPPADMKSFIKALISARC
jgi:hypothetical protein